jgi:hypothetical protein
MAAELEERADVAEASDSPMSDSLNRLSILHSTLGALSGWELRLGCDPCGTVEFEPLAKFATLVGPHQPIEWLLERLTCSTCGRKATRVDLARQRPSRACVPLIWPDTPSGQPGAAGSA